MFCGGQRTYLSGLIRRIVCSHVLLADDEAEVRELLEHRFRGRGINVTAVTNGAECLDVLATDPEGLPDAVILDVMMPRIDGFRVLREIRARYDASLPVIMLTSRGREPDTIRGLEAGATDYVTKPFSPDELLARVERFCQ